VCWKLILDGVKKVDYFITILHTDCASREFGKVAETREVSVAVMSGSGPNAEVWVRERRLRPIYGILLFISKFILKKLQTCNVTLRVICMNFNRRIAGQRQQQESHCGS